MPIQLILILAALLVSWLVFSGLLKIIKTSVATALKVALIVLVLQLAFGIAPQELWQQIINLPQMVEQFFQQQ